MFEPSPNAKSIWIKTGAIVCALLTTAGLLLGYVILHKRHVETEKERRKAAESAKASLSPSAQIFADETRLKGSQAILSGTVRNISHQLLSDLNVEIELKRRANGATETRRVKLEPAALAPGEQARYLLSVVARDWSSTRVSRLYSDSDHCDLIFKTSLGERRPTERSPEGKVTAAPRPQNGNDAFINTPDNPIPIH